MSAPRFGKGHSLLTFPRLRLSRSHRQQNSKVSTKQSRSRNTNPGSTQDQQDPLPNQVVTKHHSLSDPGLSSGFGPGVYLAGAPAPAPLRVLGPDSKSSTCCVAASAPTRTRSSSTAARIASLSSAGTPSRSSSMGVSSCSLAPGIASYPGTASCGTGSCGTGSLAVPGIPALASSSSQPCHCTTEA